MVMRVGLTGGVAAGKSAAATILRGLGACVIDADALAREVVEPGTPGYEAVVRHFGNVVLAQDGTLNRAALATIIFTDPEQRRALEAIVHPLVRARAAELEKRAPMGSIVVHEIPLLVETGQAASFDAVIVVDVPLETQVARLMESRGLSEDEARGRVAAQASREQRQSAATYVVENTGTHEDLRRKMTEVFDLLVSELD